ncbi:hypothetical protein EV129_1041 [Rhizobium azibense]|uniref:Uncharacterized protein n=1 Tax=Rhizobium azibense TaxID=1136135 RepID=A0A4R3RSG5_9HYPH|nr:hypothetical protein EV129_1041 [Rhizobium azibense]
MSYTRDDRSLPTEGWRCQGSQMRKCFESFSPWAW